MACGTAVEKNSGDVIDAILPIHGSEEQVHRSEPTK